MTIWPEGKLIVQIRDIFLRKNTSLLNINLIIAILCFAFFGLRPGPALAQDIPDLDYREHFNPFMPTLVLKYEVTYRLFGLNLAHLADALVYATDGEWLNESTGEWRKAYLLIFHLDTLEDPSEIGHGRYSIHNRLATVLLKPSLEPIIFAKRDFLHVDTFFSTMDVHNTELFSVESGKYDYIKKDFIAKSTTTNMPHFAQLVGQRGEVFRFMKTIFTVYEGNTNNPAFTNNNFTISIYTDNTFVPFIVDISPELKKVDVLDGKYKALYFDAEPAPEYSGKGRDLSVWVAPFRYVAKMTEDPKLVWLSHNTFELGMIPLKSEFGLRIGTVRCKLVRINLAGDM
jgi:hypothetical protein